MTNGFDNTLAINYKKTASFIGICPFEFTSGSSVYKRPRAMKYGPSRLRKLLDLAARSVIYHNQNFNRYYFEKLAQGKAKKLILNNVANKLLKIICAIIKSRRVYVDNYVSINPNILHI